MGNPRVASAFLSLHSGACPEASVSASKRLIQGCFCSSKVRVASLIRLRSQRTSSE